MFDFIENLILFAGMIGLVLLGLLAGILMFTISLAVLPFATVIACAQIFTQRGREKIQ